MAFWGVQVKPKKPFKLRFDEFEGAQLRLTQATLGSKLTDERTIVKCKVGDRPAVFLCSLLPGVVETCSLDLHFSEDVIFSVKGSTSVHLVGYYEGGDNEDNEEDDENEDSDDGVEYEGEDDWMEDYYGLNDSEDDEFDYEDKDTSDEEQPVMVPNPGVRIEEVTDEEPSKPKLINSGPKNIEPSNNRSIVAVKRLEKKPKLQGANVQRVLIEDNGDTAENKQILKVGKNLQNLNSTTFRDKDLQNNSSEDEDGFKRKPEEIHQEQASKRKSPEMLSSEPIGAQDNQETPSRAEMPKKAKKKKRAKKTPVQETEPLNQADGSVMTPSTQSANEIGGKVEEHDRQAGNGGGKPYGKKGTVRKYPNGFEVENVAMGKPDGKQAKPGKRVLVK